jgi:hypothetical protein
MTKLPANLITIGSRAFYECGPGIQITTLPESLTTIAFSAFTNCANVNIAILGSNNPNRGLRSIANHAFYGTGTEVKNLTLNASILELLDKPFENSYLNVVNIYNYTKYTAE